MKKPKYYVKSTSVCLPEDRVDVYRLECCGPISMKAARKELVRFLKGWRDCGGIRKKGKPLDSDFHVRPGTVHISTGDNPQTFRWYSITEKSFRTRRRG